MARESNCSPRKKETHTHTHLRASAFVKSSKALIVVDNWMEKSKSGNKMLGAILDVEQEEKKTK